MAFARRFSLFLVPSVVAMGVSFVMVPITTYVLHPEDFGLYGLMMALVAVGWTLSLVGSTAVCSQHFPRLGQGDRARLVSTMLAFSFAVALTFCAGCLLLWNALARVLDGFALVPPSALALSMTTILLGVPWMVAQEVITLDGRARGFAVVTMAQTLVSAAVTIIALYAADMGVLALFAGHAAGSAVTFAGSLRVLGPYLTRRISRVWARALFTVGPASACASISDSLVSAVERAFVGSTLGVAALGLYVHAQNYRVIVAQVLKAAARPIWPVTLMEARDEASDFDQTRIVWDAMYLTVATAGVTFAIFGPEIIGWMTHGRFVNAAPVVPVLMIFLLVQNAGKPQVGLVYRDGVVRSYYWLQVAANVAWFGFLLLLTRRFGIIGAAAALIGQQLIVRAGVHLLARGRKDVRFSDTWLVVSGAVIGLASAAVAILPATIGPRVMLWAIAMIVLLSIGRRVIARFVGAHLSRLAPACPLPPQTGPKSAEHHA